MGNPLLISIRQAASMGIERVRDPRWSNKLDHVKIDIIDFEAGPWLHLFSPINKMVSGRDPVDMLITTFDPNNRCLLAYSGPLPDSEEYKSQVVRAAEIDVKP